MKANIINKIQFENGRQNMAHYTMHNNRPFEKRILEPRLNRPAASQLAK